MLFAAMLLRYDFKLAPGASPKQIYIGTMALPDTKLNVFVRKANY